MNPHRNDRDVVFRLFDVKMTSSPDGRVTADHEKSAPGSAEARFEAWRAERVDEAFRRLAWPRTRSAGAKTERPYEVARSVGAALFADLFSDSLGERFHEVRAAARSQGEVVRLRLRMPRRGAVAQMPWELLYDGEEFLALGEQTTLVRSTDELRSRSERVVRALRVLVVSASPPGHPPVDIEGEVAGLRASASANGSIQIERLAQSTSSALAQRLGRGPECHVLHFVGHGTFDWIDGEGELLFADGSRLDGQQLAERVRRHKSLRMAVLNACETGRAATQACVSVAAGGLADWLERGGLDAVVAHQAMVDDRHAVAFASSLYRELAEGAAVDLAVRRARRTVENCDTDGAGWAMPMLLSSAESLRFFEPRRKRPWYRRSAVNFAAGALLAATVGWGVWRQDLGPSGVVADPRCPSPPGLDLQMLYVDPKPFSMGREGDLPDGERPRRVEIERPYCLGAFEVTRNLYSLVLPGREPWLNRQTGVMIDAQDPQLPANHVSWEDAKDFVEALNERDVSGEAYSLPTEAELEYVARDGKQTLYGFGNDFADLPLYANCDLSRTDLDDGFDKLAPVGSFRANDFGFFDLTGNVHELTERRDFDLEESESGDSDSIGPLETKAVRRGGSYDNPPDSCRVTKRWPIGDSSNFGNTGLRIRREPVEIDGRRPGIRRSS